MGTWALLAPGPSASAALARRVSHLPLGAVGCAWELAPAATFIAAGDAAWWRAYPAARAATVPKYCMGTPPRGIEQVRIPDLGWYVVNSGVLALECAKRAGATRILLLGFDMHGSHFFGEYTNGLSNTAESKRRMHKTQYARWARANKAIEVINCTPGSALHCFPKARLEDVADVFRAEAQPERAGAAGVHCAAA